MALLHDWPPNNNAQCARKPCVAQADARSIFAMGLQAKLLRAEAKAIRHYEEYVSDPAKPVPFRSRPMRPVGYDIDKGLTWPLWLVDDQREASGRPDVLAFTI